MTAPNHIAGGVVFTGIFCSLWNINIFSNPMYLGMTIFISLIADIDTPKSLIGKPFYPISKWIYKKFGHRTITHSLLALFCVTFFVYVFEKLQFQEINYTQIFFFAFFSHLLLDMFTITGVPLLYPFRRNPCVIPGNPAYRLKTGNIKHEGVLFFIFACCTAFMSNLFTQGFWLTYNQQFNDIKHVYREFTKSNKLYQIDYDIYSFQKKYKGRGNLIYADWKQLYILTKDSLIHLQDGQQGLKINTLKPLPTNNILTTKRVEFSHIKADSLNKLTAKKFISYGRITSSEKADVITFDRKLHDYYFELKNEYNLYFQKSLKDTIKSEIIDNSEQIQMMKHEENKLKLKQQIFEKETQIANEENAIKLQNEPYLNAKNELKIAKQNLRLETDNFTINELKNKIIYLEKFLSGKRLKTSKNLNLLKVQLRGLKARYNKPFMYINKKKIKQNNSVYFTGYFDYFLIPNLQNEYSKSF